MEQHSESWAEDIRHLSRLHEALLGASIFSCAAIKEQMAELERKLGITFEEAMARGLMPPR